MSEKQFEIAIKRLQNMDFVGITEKFDLSVDLFKSKTGIALNKIQKLNKGLDLVVQEEDICRIKDLVYYDTLFYKEAVSIFENQCVSV